MRLSSYPTLISSFIVGESRFHFLFAKTLNPKGKQGLRGAGGLPGWGKGGMVSGEGTESP